MCCMEYCTAFSNKSEYCYNLSRQVTGLSLRQWPEVSLYLRYHVHEHHHIVLCGLSSDTGVGFLSLSLSGPLSLSFIHTQPYAFMLINFITALATAQSFPSLSLSLTHTHTHTFFFFSSSVISSSSLTLSVSSNPWTKSLGFLFTSPTL